MQMVYNRLMEKITTAIIGGGAAGLFLATNLTTAQNVALFERGERVGRKLSSTGNGQGNITNLAVKETEYFSFSPRGKALASKLIRRFDERALCNHFERAGLLLSADGRGRVYPAGKQASALTDGLRYLVAAKGVTLYQNSKVTAVEKTNGGFVLNVERGEKTERFFAENVVLCAGGKAAKNFGTDGSAYALAQAFGHTVTKLYPSLVQLKTELAPIKTLKGIKVNDARVMVRYLGGEETLIGDLLFTDYGVSGDAIFRLSAFVADKIEGAYLTVDFLPDFSEERIFATLQEKIKNLPNLPCGELLCGIVNNQLARAVMKRADGDIRRAAREVKNFTLKITGTLGFDYAQVTKGGVCVDEVDDELQSKKVEGLYFAGEILDIDGQCGGFNLQWAYSSACTVAAAIDRKMQKGRGQV